MKKKLLRFTFVTFLSLGLSFFMHGALVLAATGVPTGVTAVAGNGQAVVSFSPPTDKSGIYQYVVKATPSDKTMAGVNPPIIIKGLTNGVTYTFQVKAQSLTGGDGAYSSPSAPVTPLESLTNPTDTFGPPDAPTNIVAVAGDGQASVSFTEPSPKGSIIYQYSVLSSPDAIEIAKTSSPYSPIVIKGLTNGTSYTFKVRAFSGGGVSSYSSASNAVVPNKAVSVTPTPTPTPQGPNAYGCVSTGTDSYCMLAPLPLPDSNGKVDSTGKIDTKQGIGNYFNGLIKLFMGVIGVLAVLMIIVGGIEYMTTVSIGEKEGAKSRIMNALFGLLLALSAYLILRTINPNLVNLAITVPTAELVLDEDEGPEISDVDPGTLPVVSGVTVEKGTAQDLATKILQNSRISFGVLKDEARATPKQNIVDTSTTGKAWTSARGHVGATQISLNVGMLAGILAAGNAVPIQINEIAGGRHSPNSAHYSGRAFDVQSSPNDTARAKTIMDACQAAGANPKQIFGPCNNKYSSGHAFSHCDATGYLTNVDHQSHVHCGW